MAFPTIYILRHGQTEWNIASRLQGKLDSTLTPTGREQAKRQSALLSPIFEEHPDIQVFSSPQGRALSTAEIVCERTAKPIQLEERLREISAGAWDGAFLDDIERTHGNLFEQARNSFELMFLAPDGEGEVSVLERCTSFLTEQTKPVILVTHGATLCVLRGLLRAMRFDDMLDLGHEQGCVYVIENGNETVLR